MFKYDVIGYLLILFLYFVVTRKFKWHNFGLNNLTFFLFITPTLFKLALITYQNQNFNLMVLITFLGLWGMVGETLVSKIWLVFIKQPVYMCLKGPMFGGATSYYNFIPWGVSGIFFFVAVVDAKYGTSLPLAEHRQNIFTAFVLSIFSFAVLYAIRVLIVKSFSIQFEQATVMTSIYVLLITVLPGLYLAYKDLMYIQEAAIFAVIGTLTDYLYARMVRFIFGENLWEYRVFAFRDKLSSPLLFSGYACLGFWMIGGYELFHYVK